MKELFVVGEFESTGPIISTDRRGANMTGCPNMPRM
jgi:hypothetical protein